MIKIIENGCSPFSDWCYHLHFNDMGWGFNRIITFYSNVIQTTQVNSFQHFELLYIWSDKCICQEIEVKQKIVQSENDL